DLVRRAHRPALRGTRKLQAERYRRHGPLAGRGRPDLELVRGLRPERIQEQKQVRREEESTSLRAVHFPPSLRTAIDAMESSSSTPSPAHTAACPGSGHRRSSGTEPAALDRPGTAMR